MHCRRWLARYPASAVVVTVAVIASVLLCLSRRKIAVAPALLLTFVPSCRTMISIMVAIPTDIPMLRPFTFVIIAIVVFRKCRSAHQHAR
jgi:hypothetical protein